MGQGEEHACIQGRPLSVQMVNLTGYSCSRCVCLIAALHPIHNSHQGREISGATLACSQKEQIWAAMHTAREGLGRAG